MSFNGKNIILGVSGGIGAFKACELLRLFMKAGAKVRVIMTESATKFITPLSMQSLGAEAVSVDMFEEQSYTLEHVAWADWAHILIIAPCTANMIGKIAGGIADEVLSTQVMAYSGPILLAPAMNVKMYNNKIVQKNIASLEALGYQFIGPEVGHLASLITASGRMSEPEMIFARARQMLLGKNILSGKKVIVTAGPTIEAIDPVRFISNYSSGKMGYAIADAASGMGGKVTIISGKTELAAPPNVNLIKIESAIQMQAAIQKNCAGADYLYMAAAVADYRPASYHRQKLKKENRPLELKLIPNPDLLGSLGNSRPRYVIGFALETDNLEANAHAKLRSKNLDMIVGNNPTQEGVEFGSDYNRAILIKRDGQVLKLDKMTKFDLAVRIIEESLKLEPKRGPKIKK